MASWWLLLQSPQFSHPTDRPRAKGEGVLLASRRGCSGAIQQQKRAVLCFSRHVGNDEPNSGCCIAKQRAFPKIRCDVTDRQASPDAPELPFWIFLVESTRTQPEATDRQRQSPLRAHSNTPKNGRLLRRRGAVHRPFSPLARGRSTGPTNASHHPIFRAAKTTAKI